jgi:hypothetical protein
MRIVMTEKAPRALARLAACAALAWAGIAGATPSTTYWAPSTTYVQPFLVPHVTYDTYFWEGTVAGQAGSPLYPIDVGLTMGVLPFEKLNLEIGFDLFLPSPDPLQLNAKLGAPEGAFFPGSPSLAAGIYGVGTKESSEGTAGTDFNIVYAMAQKNLPWGGYLAAGGYYGAGSRILWLGSDGSENRAGFMGAIAAPDWNVGLPGLRKIVLVADVQTGENVFGAGGLGAYLYFTDTISLLTGPVWFFDRDLQPGQRDLLWTVQLDVDVPLRPAAR